MLLPNMASLDNGIPFIGREIFNIDCMLDAGVIHQDIQ